MGIHNIGRGAALHRLANQFGRRHQRRLQMEVAVDESRTEVFSLHISFFNSIKMAYAHDDALCYSHIPFDDFSGKYINHICILKHKFCLRILLCRLCAQAVSFQFHNCPSLTILSTRVDAT